MKGDINEMYRRTLQKFRSYSSSALEQQQAGYSHLVEGIYKNGFNVYVVEVAHKTVEQVTKEVAEIIFFREYCETDLHDMLIQIRDNGWHFFI